MESIEEWWDYGITKSRADGTEQYTAQSKKRAARRNEEGGSREAQVYRAGRRKGEKGSVAGRYYMAS